MATNSATSAADSDDDGASACWQVVTEKVLAPCAKRNAAPLDENNNGDDFLEEQVVENNNNNNVDECSSSRETHHFDAIFVCSGHYSVPRIPDYIGARYERRWLHSHEYRDANAYRGMRRVAVVNAGFSGKCMRGDECLLAVDGRFVVARRDNGL